MHIFIPIHSVVDVITNSSSVIYTELRANSIELVKAIITDVLEASGSDKTVEDIFTFDMMYRPEDPYYWALEYEDEDENGEEFKLPADLKAAYDSKLSFKERRVEVERLIEVHNDTFQPIWDKVGPDQDMESYPRVTRYMKIETKEGVELKFAERALALFDIEGGYDG